MDTVIDTGVVGNIAAGHAAVCRIYDGVCRQAGDIPLPQVETAAEVLRVCNGNDAPFPRRF